MTSNGPDERSPIDHRRSGDHDLSAQILAIPYSHRGRSVEGITHLRAPGGREALTDILPVGIRKDGPLRIEHHDASPDVRRETVDVASEAIPRLAYFESIAVQQGRDALRVRQCERFHF